MSATAVSLIALRLVEHPEGGHFRFLAFSWVREEQIMGSPHFDDLRRFIKPHQRGEFEKFYD